jgi:hypothetical protein
VIFVADSDPENPVRFGLFGCLGICHIPHC